MAGAARCGALGLRGRDPGACPPDGQGTPVRRRREPQGTGYAILRDDGTWYAAGDSLGTHWRDKVREAAIFDLEATAAAMIDERLALMHPHAIFEIIPVDRNAVFGRG